MKKRFYLLVVLTLFSVSREVGAAGNLGKSDIAFSKGLLLFNDGKIEPARAEFLKSVKLNPDNASATYFIGMTYFQAENYSKAIPYFDQSITKNDSVPEPHFYRAVSLYRMGKEQESLPSFEKTEKLSGSGTLYDLAKSYRRSLTQPVASADEASGQAAPKTEKRWFLYGSLATQYDSNVILKPDTTTAVTFASDQDDVLFGIRAGGGYHLVKKGSYQLTGEANYYQSAYVQQNDFNYGMAHGELRHQFKKGKFTLNIPMSYEFSILQTTKYLQSGGLSPWASYAVGNHLFFQVSERFRYDDFIQPPSSLDQNRDAENLQTEPTVYFLFDNRKRHFKASYNFEANFAKGNDWDYKSHTVSGALYNPLFWGINSYLTASYNFNKQFKYVDSVISTKRDDSTQSYGATLSKEVLKGLTVSANYQFQRGKSNIPFFQYKRHIAGVTFAYQY